MNLHKKIPLLLAGTTLITLIAFLTGCQKANYKTYSSHDNAYFYFSDTTTDKDSIIYTFAYSPGLESDTIPLIVRLSGNRSPLARKFKLAVTDKGTTATTGVHYAALADSYTLPANEGYLRVPVIVYNSDTNLTHRSVALNLHLVATDDLGTDIADLDSARIIISNKLEKPGWWDMWLGTYSDTKFKLFIIATGVHYMTSGSQGGADAPKNLYYVSQLTGMMQDPFAWVTANSSKGYVLELRSDGNYDFYNTATPNSRILLQKGVTPGTFYFIDEKGGQVS